MDSEYLRHWHRQCPDSKLQRLVNWLVRRRVGLPNRHAYFLYRLLQSVRYQDTIKLLEIGPGSGWALSYARPGLTKYAIDRDDHFREHVESLGARFFTADVEAMNLDALPIDFREFDLIVLNHIIEHIWDVDAFVCLLGSLLKSSGSVYVRTPDIRRVGFKFYQDYTHVRPFCRSSLAQLFQSHGFSAERIGCTSSSLFYAGLVLPFRQSKMLEDAFGKDIEGVFVKSD